MCATHLEAQLVDHEVDRCIHILMLLVTEVDLCARMHDRVDTVQKKPRYASAAPRERTPRNLE